MNEVGRYTSISVIHIWNKIFLVRRFSNINSPRWYSGMRECISRVTWWMARGVMFIFSFKLECYTFSLRLKFYYCHSHMISAYCWRISSFSGYIQYILLKSNYNKMLFLTIRGRGVFSIYRSKGKRYKRKEVYVFLLLHKKRQLTWRSIYVHILSNYCQHLCSCLYFCQWATAIDHNTHIFRSSNLLNSMRSQDIFFWFPWLKRKLRYIFNIDYIPTVWGRNFYWIRFGFT